jgi:hypothetical protein
MQTYVVVHRQTDLLEVARALGAPSGFTRGLNGRQQQADENADNRDNDKQLNQGKTAASTVHGSCPLSNG